MGLLRRLLGRESQRARLERDLARLPIDWRAFARRADGALRLLRVELAIDRFRTAPSPATLAQEMEALLQRDQNAALELREFVLLAALENALLEGRVEAERQGPDKAYLYFSYYLPLTVRRLLDGSKSSGGRFPAHTWLAAYLSACTEQESVLPIDDACKAALVWFGQGAL